MGIFNHVRQRETQASNYFSPWLGREGRLFHGIRGTPEGRRARRRLETTWRRIVKRGGLEELECGQDGGTRVGGSGGQ